LHPSPPLGSNTKENSGETAKKYEEPEDKNLHLPNSGFDEALGLWLTHCMTTSSHTDESKSKPSRAFQVFFMSDALPEARLYCNRYYNMLMINELNIVFDYINII